MDFSKQWRAVLAEFISTLMLIFFGCMSCIPIEGMSFLAGLYGALGFGLTTMCNVHVFGHISGAFMNPYLTMTAVIWGKLSLCLGVACVIAECAGAVAGYGLLVVLAPADVAADGVCVAVSHKNINSFQALGIEVLLAAALSLAMCSALDPATGENTDSLPLKFGFIVAGLGIAGGHSSGAGINPARALGPALWANRWDGHWVYWVGPFIGTVVTAVFYKYIWLQKVKPKPPNRIPSNERLTLNM